MKQAAERLGWTHNSSLDEMQLYEPQKMIQHTFLAIR